MVIVLRFSLFLLLGLSLPALADPIPLPLETMPGKSFADVQAQAKTESGTGPVWGNAPDPVALPFHATLSGSVTADATMTKLAIFSDDGCDVTVDGVKVWSARDKPQALPDLPNSLHELPVTLTPGTHTVQIDYSNVIYTVADAANGIPPDIDGCTLFQYGPKTVVNVLTGGWQPNPAAVGQTITSDVKTRVDNPYQSSNGDSISEHWAWDTTGVYQSKSSTSGSFTAYTGGYTISWAEGSPTTTFSGSFSDGGFYIIKVTATLTYHDDTTGKDVGTYTGDGYIGGSAGDLAPPAASPAVAPSAASPRVALRPRAAGVAPAAGTGLPVVQVTKLQYAFGTSTTFQELPASPTPLSVDAGTTVVFKAIPDTTGAAFPAGQPVWSGVQNGVAIKNAVAKGDTYTITFTSLNKSILPADFQVVTAKVGTSTASANVVVQGVNITVGALANTDPNASATPLLRRVNVNGTVYGSGTTLSLIVTPVNGFNRTLTLDVDRRDTQFDVFGLVADAFDLTYAEFNYSFYEPVYHSVSLPDGPSSFTLDFSDNQPKTAIITLTLSNQSVMAARSYHATVFANPNEQGNTRMGNELSLPVTVAENTAPPSAGFTGGAHDGLYKVGRTYYPTGSNANNSKTGSFYDALSGTLTLPPTSPDSASLVLDYGSSDAYDIYSGGLARDPTTGNAHEIDVGLIVGHTGNLGYSPTGNYLGVERPPTNNPYDQILPGAIGFTFEAPGYQDPTLGVVPANTAYLVIQGGSISPKLGMPAAAVASQIYKFTNLPDEWISDNHINVKYTTSIAQSSKYGATYNGPPNFNLSPNAHVPFFYTSGSKTPYVTWSGLSVHVQNTASGMATISLPADEASPGSLYVTSSILNTVP